MFIERHYVSFKYLVSLRHELSAPSTITTFRQRHQVIANLNQSVSKFYVCRKANVISKQALLSILALQRLLHLLREWLLIVFVMSYLQLNLFVREWFVGKVEVDILLECCYSFKTVFDTIYIT